MTTLAERLPMIPRLAVRTPQATALARAYTGWYLLEVDYASGEILICESHMETEHNRSRSLIILGGTVAQAWLKAHQTASV